MARPFRGRVVATHDEHGPCPRPGRGGGGPQPDGTQASPPAVSRTPGAAPVGRVVRVTSVLNDWAAAAPRRGTGYSQRRAASSPLQWRPRASWAARQPSTAVTGILDGRAFTIADATAQRTAVSRLEAPTPREARADHVRRAEREAQARGDLDQHGRGGLGGEAVDRLQVGEPVAHRVNDPAPAGSWARHAPGASSRSRRRDSRRSLPRAPRKSPGAERPRRRCHYRTVLATAVPAWTPAKLKTTAMAVATHILLEDRTGRATCPSAAGPRAWPPARLRPWESRDW